MTRKLLYSVLLSSAFLLATQAWAQVPSITSFTPLAGAVGATVTITGTNFNATAANNVVIFGATRAAITSATNTQLVVTVPTGATYAPITILNTANGLLAYSKSKFTPTFSPNTGSITAADFSTKVDFTTAAGSYPSSVAFGDIDGDGKVDISIANSGSNTISIFRNTSSISTVSYATKADFNTGTGPVFMAMGDLDGDGKIDLAVTNANSNSVSVLRNTSSVGAVSFAAKVDFTTGANPNSVAIGDLDGDGKNELAVANFSNSNTLSIFRNIGSVGTINFATKLDFTTGSYPKSVAMGDLDGDGKVDLSVANRSGGTVSIFRNTSSVGSISCAAKVDFTTGLASWDVATGDLDGDGKLDLAVLNLGTFTVSTFRNLSSIGAISFASKVDYATGGQPYSVALGDLDGDAKVDLTIANYQDNTVSLIRNTGSSGTINFAAKLDLTTGFSPQSVAIADLDGDGKSDLAIANDGSDNFSVLLKLTAPTIASFNPTSASAGSTVTISGANFTGVRGVSFGGVAATSFNVVSSNTISAVVSSGASGVVAVTSNGGAATKSGFTFTGVSGPPSVSSFTPLSGGVGTSVTITGTNFNATAANNIVFFGAIKATVTAASTTSLTVTVPIGATYAPIAILDATTGSVVYSNAFFTPSFSPNKGSISDTDFSNTVNFSARQYADNSYSTSIGDLDGDGKSDLVVANYNSSTISILRNIGSSGIVNFASKLEFTTGSSSAPTGVAIGDIDGDSKVDLVVSNNNSSSRSISVFRNISSVGIINFAPKVDFILPVGYNPIRVAIGDLDGDGKADLAVSTSGSTVTVLRNSSSVGFINFLTQQDFATGSVPQSIAINDFDGDSRADLAVLNYSAGTVSLLRNTSSLGAINFAPKIDFNTGTSPRNLAIGDLDGDGKNDLAVANTSGATLSLLRNVSTAGAINFAAKIDLVATAPQAVAIGDLDGDGIPDIAVSNSNNGGFSVFKNKSSQGSLIFNLKVDIFTGLASQAIAIGDLDGDGKSDLVLTPNDLSNAISIIRNNPVFPPTITSFAPITAATGTTVTIAGTNLTGATSVSFGGTAATSFSVVSATSITAIVAAGASGPVSITTSGGTVTSASNFTYILPVPSITSFTPTNAGSGTSVSITGTNFTGATAVSFGGTAAASFSVLSSTNITAAVAAGTSGDVSVTAPGGAGTKSGFTFIPAPTITNFSPSSAAAGTTVTITGTNFTGATSVKFGNVAASTFTVVSATSITAVVASGASGTISVATSGGTTTSNGFTFIAPPTITSFTPVSAGAGTTVNITGTNFTGASSVSFGGTAATSFTVVSSTSINAIVATGSSGIISVTALGGTATSAGFSFIGPPTITSFTPTSAAGGASVTITGANFTGATAVSFGDTPASSFSVLSATSILATVANGATGSISVTTPGGNAVLPGFTYLPPPTITAFSPTSGAVGTTVIINGSTFDNTPANNIVFFGATKASVTTASSTALTVTVPVGATYSPISVLNKVSGLTAYSKINFTPTFSPNGSIGSGNFGVPVEFATGDSPNKVVISDLDGDGKPDLVVSNLNSNTVSIFRNTSSMGSISSGSFATKIDFATTSYPASLAIGDVDGDGKPDIIIGNGNKTFSVFRNTATSGSISSGSFASKVDFTTSIFLKDIAMGDLDNDGKLDLVFGNNSSSSKVFTIVQNKSTIGSISFSASIDFTTDNSPTNVALGDIDRDGKLDMAVANGQSISVFKNNSTTGTINSTSFSPKVDFQVKGSSFVTLGDIDGNGKQDIIVATGGFKSVSILPNVGATGVIDNNSFGGYIDFPTNSNSQPNSLALADIDGDNLLDIIASLTPIYNSGNSLSIYHNTSSVGNVTLSSFDPRLDLTPTSQNAINSIAVGDLDGDGRPDLAATTPGTSKLTILRNNPIVAPPSVTSFSPASASAGDLVTINGSNFSNATSVTFGGTNASSFTVVSSTKITAVVPGGTSGSIFVTTPGGSSKADGFTFLPPLSIASFSPMAGTAGTLVTITGNNFNPSQAGNLVFFGTVKAVVSSASSTSITVSVPVSATYGPITLLNTATKLAASSRSNFTPTFSPNKGSIASTDFNPQVDFAVESGTQNVALGDLDGDGKLDMIVASSNFNKISVFRNITSSIGINGSSFATKVDFSTGSQPQRVAIGDVDNDGKPDIIVTEGYGSFSVLRNTSINGVINSGSFAPKVSFSAGISPSAVVLSDIDADGKLDVVIADQNNNSVYVYKNTSSIGIDNSSFGPLVIFAVGNSPASIALADLDGDGKPDLIGCNRVAGTLSILQNIGTSGIINTSTFASKIDFSIGQSITDVVAGDIDGDSRLDLVVTNDATNKITLLQNTITNGIINYASFANKVDFAHTLAPDQSRISIGDIDGDGKPDLAVSNAIAKTISILRNTATVGSLDATSLTAKVDITSTSPSSLAIGDLDGDSKPDIVAVNGNPSAVSVFRNSPPVLPPTITTFTPANAGNGGVVTINGTNFNGASAVSFGGIPATSFSVLSSNSITATVSSGATGSISVTTPGGTAVSPGFNFLLTPKINSFLPGSGQVGTTITISGSNFNPVPTNNIVVFGATKATVTVATVTQLTVTVPAGATFAPITVLDATTGLAASSANYFTPTFTPSKGNITSIDFNPKINFATGSVPFSVATGDLDGDGKTDLAIANYLDNSVSVLRNTSNTGVMTYSTKVDFATGSSPRSLAMSDLDGDGKAELVVVNAGTVSILLNTGSPNNINFAPKIDLDLASANSPDVALGDVDGDGKPDIVANSGAKSVLVFRNTSFIGSISYSIPIVLTAGNNPSSVEVGDLDGDGKVEIVVSNQSSNTVSIFRNTGSNGALSFDSKVDLVVGNSPIAISLGDLDGDTWLDIAVASVNDNTVSVFRSISSPGLLSFASKVDLTTGTSPYAVSISDLDGDGKLDLAATNRVDNTVSIFKNTSNQGTISISPKVDFAMGTFLRSISIGDFDNDGKPDIAAVNENSNTVSIIKNNPIFPPTITNFTPITGGSGLSVTINGTYLTGASAISFGGIPAASFTVVSATSITAVVASGSSGVVSVTTPGGTTTSPGFIFVAPPTITSYTPTSGGAGTTVSLTGTNFTGATAVSFGGIAATSFTVVSSTSITAVVASGASGVVSVTTLGGTATSPGFTFIPAPTIASFMPTSAATGATVTITGTNFTGVSAVSFGGTPATSTTLVSSTTITAVVASGASGSVSVTTPGGTATSAGFTFIPPPTISSFTPTSAAIGATVTITGTNFTGATVVSFGGTLASSITGITATSITAVVASGGASGSVSVTTPGGTATSAGFIFIPAPTITSFTPSTAAAGATVTITGTNLTGATAVSFGGTPVASITGVSATSITAVVASGTSGSVSVTTPGGTATKTGFTFIPPPTISSFTPTTAATGAIVTITGTNFTGATAVSFGGTLASSITGITATSITAVVAGGGASGSVSVTTPGGTATSAGFIFIPAPTITSFTPSNAATGATVTITGTDFTGATAVSFGGTPAASFNVVSATSLTAVLASGTSGVVSVTTPGGTATSPGFTFIAPPTISSFSPVNAGAGTTVTLTGTNFTGATAVSFGGTSATSFSVVSATSLTAVVASGTTGVVSVTTPGGTATKTGFTFIPPPTISSFTPTSATTGTTVTITGTNFTAGTSVSFGGTPASSTTVVSSNSITAVVGSGTSGSISVTTSGGTTNAVGFTYLQLPAINSFAPTSGGVGSTITVTGTGFSPIASNNIVIFGATRAIVTAATTNSLTVTVPAGATYAPITVLNTTSSLLSYSNNNFTPTFTPNKGSITTTDFSPKQEFNSGSTPYSVVVGDLDGDGKADLAVANLNSSSVSIFRNISSGAGNISYAPKLDFTTGLKPTSIAIGDLDGDGKADLAVTNQGSSSVSVFRNLSTSLGNIDYTTKVDFVTASVPYAVAIGDLDGDGKADLAVTNFIDNSVSVLMNSSSGVGNISYAAKIDFPTGIAPQSVSIGDLDGDGRADLAVANGNSGSVSVLRNTSTGAGNISYSAKVDFSTGLVPQFITIGDLDGDSKADLAVVNASSASISLLRNTSTGVGNISYAGKMDFATGSTPYAVAIGDLDGDGKPDLAVANYGSGTASVLRNISSIGTINYTNKVDLTTGSGPFSVSIGDLDGDGKPDLVAANSNNTISIIRNNPQIPPTINSFTPTTGAVGTTITIAGTSFNPTADNNIVIFGATRATVTAASTTSLTVAVPTGATYSPITVLDATTGLVAYSNSNFTPTFSPNKGSITASDFSPQVDLTTGADPYFLASKDLDGDGKTDLVAVNYPSNTVSVFRNTGSNGTISYAPKIDLNTGTGPISVALEDLDGDGKADIVVGNSSGGTVSTFHNTTSNGLLSFATKVDFEGGPYVSSGDLDGDGKPDLAVGWNSTVSVLRNKSSIGIINFDINVSYFTIGTSGSVSSIGIGDIDRDGKADLALSNSASNTVSILKNTSTVGVMNFASKVDFATGSNPYSVAIGDLDGDGKADLVVSNHDSNSVSFFQNNGTAGAISFAAKMDRTIPSPFSVSLGDLDGDSKIDVSVGVNTGQNILSIFRNISVGGALNYIQVDVSVNSPSKSVIIGDLDGDGKPEIVFSYYGSKISILRNNPQIPPIINSFTPSSGAVGTTVTIAGTSFNPTAANNIVIFGATRATVTSASTTSLTVTVPVGAMFAPITVLDATTGLVAYSNSNFTPTFSPNKGSISASDFSPKQDFTTGSYPQSVAIGDLDGDGKADLAVGNASANTVSILLNTGVNGSVSYASKVDFATGGSTSIAIGDLDGDGKADLAVVSALGNTVSILRNKSTVGSVNYEAKIDFPAGSQPLAVAIGDVDGDGKPDLGMTNSLANTVSILLNNGSRGKINFAAKLDFATSEYPRALAFGDLDGDGKTDLAVANNHNNTVSIIQNVSNNGNFGLSPKVDFSVGSSPYSVAIGDLNGDGKAEVVVANFYGNSVSVLRNTSVGSLSYATKLDLSTDAYPMSVAIGDMDGDGKVELVSANNIGSVSVLRNMSNGISLSYSPKIDLPTSSGSVAVAVGDLDGDGKSDLAVTNQSNSTVSVIRNNTVLKQDQTITFNSLVNKTFGDAPFNLNAISSSGLALTYSSSDTNIATVSGSTVTLVAPGPVTITAFQTGNTTYNAAVPVTQTFCINPAQPSFTVSSSSLTSNVTSGNQWYFGGTAISSGTNQTLSISQSGMYQVTTTVGGCTSAFSMDQYVVVGTNSSTTPITANNFTVAAGATITAPPTISVATDFVNNGSLDANGGTLNLGGNFTNSGTFKANGGIVVFNGSTQQSVNGSVTLNDITVNNSSDVKIEGSVGLNGQLSLLPNAVFDADGTGGTGVFTLLSASVVDGGSIGTLTTPANFMGKVSVQRYIGHNLYWQYLAFPFTDLTVADLQNSFPVTGHYTSGGSIRTDGGDNSAESIYYYDATIQDWAGFGIGKGATNTVLLSNTIGYSAWAYGSPNLQLLMNQKTIAKGDITIPLIQSWNLIPNPYPAPISYSSIQAGSGGLLGATVYLQADGGGHGDVYASSDGTVCSNCNVTNFNKSNWKGEIAMGQSFWVNASSNGSITMHETDKTTNSSTFAGREASASNYIRVSLISGSMKDEALVLFDATGSLSYNSKKDGLKRLNGAITTGTSRDYVNVSTYKGDSTKALVFNYVPKLDCNNGSIDVPIVVSDLAKGSHILKFTDLESFALGYRITLLDKFLATQASITNGTEYNFNTAENPKSYGYGRFILRFEYIPSIPSTITVNGNMLSSSNASSNQWYKDGKIIPGATGASYIATEPGKYSVRSVVGGCETESLPVIYTVTGLEELTKQVSVYPNPAGDYLKVSMPLELLDELKVIKLLDSKGVSSEITGYSNNGSELTINTENLSPGLYILQLLYDKSTQSIKVVKK